MSKNAPAEERLMPPPGGMDRVGFALFGDMARKRVRNHPRLSDKLSQARIPLVPAAYLAGVYLRVTLAASLGLLMIGGYAFLVVSGAQELVTSWIVPMALTPMLFGAATYAFLLLQPDLKIGARRRDLEANLPYGLNFMAALAGAGVVPTELFGSLGANAVYGVLSQECTLIYRDTRLFSRDLVEALKAAAKRSPSPQFQEFLLGSVNTVTSGGDLKTYFLAKAEALTTENRRKQRAFLESLGVMAESYVVVAAAAPLFLIVILSVMVLLLQGGNPILYLNILILLGLPVIHGTFTWILSTMTAD